MASVLQAPTGTPFLFDRPPIILDFGHFSVRLGFAGDELPRLEVPAPGFLLECLYGDGRQEQVEGSLALDVSRFLAALLVNDLCIKPSDHKALLVEGSVMPLHLKDAITATLTSELRCPSVASIRHPVASLFASAGAVHTPHIGMPTVSWTGLVVDIGWRDARITPVVQGHAMEEATRCSPFSSRFLAHFAAVVLADALATALTDSPDPRALLSSHTGGSVAVSASSGPKASGAGPSIHASLPLMISNGTTTDSSRSPVSNRAPSCGASLSSYPPLLDAASTTEGATGCHADASVGDQWLFLVSRHAKSSSSMSSQQLVRALNLLSRDPGVGGQVLQWAVTVARGQAQSIYTAMQREIDSGVPDSGSPAELAAALPPALVATLRHYLGWRASSDASGAPSASTAAPFVRLGGDQMAALRSAFRSVLFPEQLLEIPPPVEATLSADGGLSFVLSVLSSLGSLLRRYCTLMAPESPLDHDICNALLHCPVDARRDVASNVVFCGGLASSKGLVGAVMASVLRLMDPASEEVPSRRLLANGASSLSSSSTTAKAAKPAATSSSTSPSSRYAPLRPLADVFALGNLHAPSSTAFAGASIVAAAAATTNVPMPLDALPAGATLAGSGITGGTAAPPAYAQVSLDRGGRVTMTTASSGSSAVTPAVLVDAFSMVAALSSASSNRPATVPAPAPVASAGASTTKEKVSSSPPASSTSVPTGDGGSSGAGSSSGGTTGAAGSSASAGAASSIAARLAKVQAAMRKK